VARKKFVCGNWKMHKTAGEAVALVRELAAGLGEAAGKVQVAVAPPFTALHAVANALGGPEIELAAQDVHWEAQGAFTGEVSAAMLADCCCTHGIVGHSERRQLFGETDESVRKKVGALLAANVLPELGGSAGEVIRIQYGGSVKPENAAELMSQADVDGALVGGASLKAKDFLAIVKGALR